MGLSFVSGNILNTHCNIIVQSVNHKGVMGAGLAREIKTKYPDISSSYIHMCNTHNFRSIMRNGLVYFYTAIESDGSVKQIASVFGQESYGIDKRHTNYISLMNGIMWVLEYAESQGYSVAIPYGIGCGLGGGVWDIVILLLKDILVYYPDVDVYIYKN
jgi:O-acetyl-ADP-ribose deacetylase (regulator of RNase III)